MNKEELRNLLITNNIPEYYFNLDGFGEVDQRVCLEYKEEWIVYYSERGKKYDICRFNTENEACQEILKRLLVQ